MEQRVFERNPESKGRGPVLGWLCSYTPVEIALAAGYMPKRISGGEALPRARDPRIYHLLCPFVRAVFHRFASGEEAFPDSVAFVRCCDAMVRLHDVWKAYLPGHLWLLDLPKISSPEAVRYFAHVLEEWASALGREGPREVTVERLQEAIRWMNRARSAFREIFSERTANPDGMLFETVHGWSRRWLAEPTAECLDEILTERSGATAVPSAPGGPKVLLTSSMLDQPALIRMIQDTGLEVVVEDECMGARHYDRDVSEEGDPYLAIAERYLSRWPCPRMHGHERRWERLSSLMEQARVEGVIVLQLKYCDQCAFDIPLLKGRCEAKGVPLLVVENDYGEAGSGQIRVRIEAFAEMLQQPWT